MVGDSEKRLQAALAGRKVVALFHSTWCPFCRAFVPAFRSLAKGGAWEPLEVVVDEYDDPLWERYRLDVVPTVIFFDDGAIEHRVDGEAGVGIEEATFREALARV